MAEQSSNGPATGGFDFAAFSAARAGQPSDMKILGSAEGPSLFDSSSTDSRNAPLVFRGGAGTLPESLGSAGTLPAKSSARRSTISSLADSIGEMKVGVSDKPAGTCTSCGGGSSAGAASMSEMAGDSPPAMTSGQTQESLPGGESFNNGDLPSRNPADSDFRSDDSFLELGGGHDPSLGLQIGLPAGATRPAPGSLASRLGMDFTFEGVGAGAAFAVPASVAQHDIAVQPPRNKIADKPWGKRRSVGRVLGGPEDLDHLPPIPPGWEFGEFNPLVSESGYNPKELTCGQAWQVVHYLRPARDVAVDFACCVVFQPGEGQRIRIGGSETCATVNELVLLARSNKSLKVEQERLEAMIDEESNAGNTKRVAELRAELKEIERAIWGNDLMIGLVKDSIKEELCNTERAKHYGSEVPDVEVFDGDYDSGPNVTGTRPATWGEAVAQGKAKVMSEVSEQCSEENTAAYMDANSPPVIDYSDIAFAAEMFARLINVRCGSDCLLTIMPLMPVVYDTFFTCLATAEDPVEVDLGGGCKLSYVRAQVRYRVIYEGWFGFEVSCVL